MIIDLLDDLAETIDHGCSVAWLDDEHDARYFTRPVATTAEASRNIEFLPGLRRTLGWAFIESVRGDVLWQHGDNAGFKHVAAVRPSTGEAVLVLTNSDDGQAFYRTICREVFEVEVW